MSSVVIKDEPVGPGDAEGNPPEGHADNSPSARPEHIPEKFWDAEKGEPRYEDLAKSYTELEKKLGQQGTPEEKPEVKPEDPAKDAEGETVANILEANGLNPERFTVEISTNGELSEESYQELASKGFPREMVDQYLAGAGLLSEANNVLQEAQLNEVYDVVGGEESYGVLRDWAAQNVEKGSLSTYNDMVNSGNVAQAKAAVTWLKSMYTEANGSEPKLVSGQTNAASSAEPFRSTAQVTQAMRDPRYQTDPAYREEVYKRLAASKM